MSDSFEALPVYQQAVKMRQRVFKLVAHLPKEEKFVLNPTLRKAALGVTNQIAQSAAGDNWKQMIGTLHRAEGGVNQIIDCLSAAEDQKHFKAEHLADLRNDAEEVRRLIGERVAELQQQIQQYMREKREKRGKAGGNRGKRSNG